MRTVFMWYFRTRGGGRDLSTAGRSFEVFGVYIPLCCLIKFQFTNKCFFYPVNIAVFLPSLTATCKFLSIY